MFLDEPNQQIVLVRITAQPSQCFINKFQHVPQRYTTIPVVDTILPIKLFFHANILKSVEITIVLLEVTPDSYKLHPATVPNQSIPPFCATHGKLAKLAAVWPIYPKAYHARASKAP